MELDFMRPMNHQVGNGYRCWEYVNKMKGVREFGSALLRCKLAWDGVRGFGIGKGCSGMV